MVDSKRKMHFVKSKRSMNGNTNGATMKWLHPNDLLKLQMLKLKKKQLQARINPSENHSSDLNKHNSSSTLKQGANKRPNPFVKPSESKRFRINPTETEESSDQTLFKLLHTDETNSNATCQPTTFQNVLTNLSQPEEKPNIIESSGKSWIPVDWSLKSKVRLTSSKPFAWNQKLKVSEEASGITAFARCLDNNCETTLDTSPNSKFHQCCLYWQYPSFPWLNLFPRHNKSSLKETSVAANPAVRESLHRSWCDSLRSVFQLVRTRQCPYFYVCANNYTVLFRAAGICGCIEMNAIITPTTRGFRQLLKREDIDFSMPLKSRRSDVTDEDSIAYEDDEPTEEEWMQSMGLNTEDIKQINYTQQRISHNNECGIDNSEQSLVLIEGMEVHGLYNFLLNSKSTLSTTGPLAGIPPTLLSQVAFQGGTLSALKVKESKVRIDNLNYFSLEIVGPILPNFIHNLCGFHPIDQDLLATFANLNNTLAFNKVKAINCNEKENENKSSSINRFGEINLSDCGLSPRILTHFCTSDVERVGNIESLKYRAESKTYTWS